MLTPQQEPKMQAAPSQVIPEPEKELLPALLELEQSPGSQADKFGRIIEGLRSQRAAVREGAAVLLGDQGDEQCVRILLEMLDAEDWWARRGAALALREVGLPEAVAGLVSSSADVHPSVREAALEALQAIGSKHQNTMCHS